MTARVAALVGLVLAVGACATPPRAHRGATTGCPEVRAVESRAPLPERPHRWWWGAAEPGRVALRASYGLAGCPPVLQ